MLYDVLQRVDAGDNGEHLQTDKGKAGCLTYSVWCNWAESVNM